MPRLDPRSQGRAPDIGALRERVVICTTVERPDGDISTIVKRPGVIEVHASVRALRGEEVLNWRAVFASPQAPNVEITVRVPPDVKIDLNHWVWHTDLYRETWYKVRTVEDLGGVRRFLVLLCSVDTVRDKRGDPATQAPPPTWETPGMTDDVVEDV